MKAVAEPNSPPAEKPWMSRETTMSSGAPMPMAAYVGANAMSATPSVMRAIVSVSAALRPCLSPYAPSTIAPIGRMR